MTEKKMLPAGIDEHWAHIRAERIKILQSPAFNRLRIKECIAAYNRKVNEHNKLHPNDRRDSMTKARLTIQVLPEVSYITAKQYLTHWDKGSRFTQFDPSKIYLLARALNCSPCDFLESI